jgi:hypothetical protein
MTSILEYSRAYCEIQIIPEIIDGSQILPGVFSGESAYKSGRRFLGQEHPSGKRQYSPAFEAAGTCFRFCAGDKQ